MSIVEKSDKMDLENMMERLESAVAKMELMATSNNQPISSDPNKKEHLTNDVKKHLTNIVKEHLTNNVIKDALKSDEPPPIWLSAYNHFHRETVNPFLGELLALGDEFEECANLLMDAFNAHEILLNLAANYDRPSKRESFYFLKPLIDSITAVQKFQHKYRGSKYHKFFTSISEGVPFLAWITMGTSIPPWKYMRPLVDSAEYFANQVGIESKDSNSEIQKKIHKCSQDWISLISGFRKYLSAHHLSSGLRWNAEKPRLDMSYSWGRVKNQIAPPPPSLAGSTEEDTFYNNLLKPVFSELRHMDGRKNTCQKNTGRRKTRDRCMKSSKTETFPWMGPPPKPPKGALGQIPPAPPHGLTPPVNINITEPSLIKKGPVNVKQMKKIGESSGTEAVFELQNKKWVVEYQENNSQMIIEDCNERQSVYMYKCKNSFLHVKGKINTIVLDNCTKCSLVFEDAISTCSFINCESSKAQVNGFVPSITIEHTDGLQLYIKEKCLIDTQLITAKTSNINICIFKEDGDEIEIPIKEQFRSVWDGHTLHTAPVVL